MPIVVDCSVTIAWSVSEKDSEFAERVLARVGRNRAIVPAIWTLEIANSILNIVRRKRAAMAQGQAIIHDLSALPIEVEAVEQPHVFNAVFDLAGQLGLSIYDACYLELAQRRGLPLATLDIRLKSAAQKIGVETL